MFCYSSIEQLIHPYASLCVLLPLYLLFKAITFPSCAIVYVIVLDRCVLILPCTSTVLHVHTVWDFEIYTHPKAIDAYILNANSVVCLI